MDRTTAMIDDEPTPADELVVTLEVLGGGLIGIAAVLFGIAVAVRRWWYVAD